MTTIKLKFRPSSVHGAEGRLYYLVSHKRQTKWLRTGHHILPCEWDELQSDIRLPATPERRAAVRLVQAAVSREMQQRRTLMHEMLTANAAATLDELCEAFSRIAPWKSVFTFLHEQVARQKLMQRQGTATTYGNAYVRFREFRNGEDLAFTELTPELMLRYEAWLTNRGLKQNTICFYLRTLNTMLCRAADDGLLDGHHELFSRVRLSFVATTKRAISEADVRRISRLRLPDGSATAFARDIFMFSFYMRGMPFVDIAFLRKADLRNGLLSYCRKKTNQQLHVQWEREQQDIVSRYAHLTKGSPYMFPIIRHTDGTEYRQYKRAQENVNRALKRLGNMIGLRMPLTLYVARHSWASIAQNLNYSLSIISEGMGHQSIKTTQTYLASIDTSRINEANRHIIRRISTLGGGDSDPGRDQ